MAKNCNDLISDDTRTVLTKYKLEHTKSKHNQPNKLAILQYASELEKEIQDAYKEAYSGTETLVLPIRPWGDANAAQIDILNAEPATITNTEAEEDATVEESAEQIEEDIKVSDKGTVRVSAINNIANRVFGNINSLPTFKYLFGDTDKSKFKSLRDLFNIKRSKGNDTVEIPVEDLDITKGFIKQYENFLTNNRENEVRLTSKEKVVLNNIKELHNAIMALNAPNGFIRSMISSNSPIVKTPIELLTKDGVLPSQLLEIFTAAIAEWVYTDSAQLLYQRREDVQEAFPNANEEELRTLIYSGFPVTEVADKIGSVIYRHLGLQLKDDVELTLKERMVTNLGQAAIAFMSHPSIGFVKVHTPNKSKKGGANFVRLNIDPDVLISKGSKLSLDPQYSAIDMTDVVSPLFKQLYDSYKPLLSKEEGGDGIERGNSNKAYSSVVTKLFGSKGKVTKPRFTPEPNINPNYNKLSNPVPEEVMERLKEYSSQPWRLNLELVNFLDKKLKDRKTIKKFLRIVLNYKNIANEPKYLQDNAEGYNKGIDREIDNLLEFISDVKEQAEIQGVGINEVDFYFDYTSWSNNRKGIVANAFNIQNSKLHRFFSFHKDWTYDFTKGSNSEDEIYYKVGLAQGFGIDVENSTIEQVLEKFDELVESPVIQDVVKTRNTKNLIKAVKSLKEKTHSLTALMSYLDYVGTKDGTKFTSNIGIEADAKNQGVLLGRLILKSHMDSTTNDFSHRVYAAGGIYFEGGAVLPNGDLYTSENPNFPEYKEAGGLDNYQLAVSRSSELLNAYLSAKSVDELVNDYGLNEHVANDFVRGKYTLDSIKNVFGDIVGQLGEITKEARESAKDPVMQAAYGAGIAELISNAADKAIGNFHKKYIEADDKTRKAMGNSLRQMTGVDLPANVDLTKQEINANAYKTIKKTYENTVGRAFKESLKESKESIETETKLISGSTEALTLIYGFLLDQYKKNLGTKPFSKKAKREFMEKFADALPYIPFATSEEINEGMFLPKSMKGVKDRDQQVFLNIHSGLKGNSTTPLSTPIYERLVDIPGVSAFVKQIHGFDSHMIDDMSNEAILMIFDAILASPKDIFKLVDKFNNAYKKINDFDIYKNIRTQLEQSQRVLMENGNIEEFTAYLEEYYKDESDEGKKRKMLSVFSETVGKQTYLNEATVDAAFQQMHAMLANYGDKPHVINDSTVLGNVVFPKALDKEVKPKKPVKKQTPPPTTTTTTTTTKEEPPKKSADENKKFTVEDLMPKERKYSDIETNTSPRNEGEIPLIETVSGKRIEIYGETFIAMRERVAGTKQSYRYAVRDPISGVYLHTFGGYTLKGALQIVVDRLNATTKDNFFKSLEEARSKTSQKIHTAYDAVRKNFNRRSIKESLTEEELATITEALKCRKS